MGAQDRRVHDGHVVPVQERHRRAIEHPWLEGGREREAGERRHNATPARTDAATYRHANRADAQADR
jgi:hypothetical protein